MAEVPENRQFPRLSTGSDYGVHFCLDGKLITSASLQNISAGGCGLQVSMADAAHMELGLVLKELYLDHPWLPYVPLEGQIVRLLGKVAGKTSGYVLVGVEFAYITLLVLRLVQAHVEERLRERAP